MANLAAHPRSRQLTAMFLSALQTEGYPLGVGHHQAVQELLERLPEGTSEKALGNSLVAIFATSAIDQENCRKLFAQAQAQADETEGTVARSETPAFAQEAREDRRKLARRLLGLLGILLLPLLAFLLWPEQEIVMAERSISVVENRQNYLPDLDSLEEIGAVWEFELPAEGSKDYPVLGKVDTLGKRVFYTAGAYDSLYHKDAFILTLHGEQKRYAKVRYTVAIHKDTARTLVQGRDDEAKDDGSLEPDFNPIDPLPHPRSLANLVVPEPKGVGFADFIRYAWWPLLFIGFGILLFGLYLYLRYLRRKQQRLVAERDQFDGAPHFWRIELPELRAGIDWGVNYTALLRQLRRRREDDHLELDIDGSIRQTINHGGLPSFQYRSTTRPAEYLLLIDRGVHANHYTRLFDELYHRLHAEEVLIERYFYDGDPRLLYKDNRTKSIPLKSLQQRYTNSRLLIVGPGDRLLSPATGKLAKWATDQFGPWEHKSLLTTLPPGQWGVEERRLATFFNLLPATMQGLRLLVERINNGESGENDVDFSSIIEDAEHKPIRFSGSLVGSLLDHFSLAETQWVAACALYPSLHWDLTLFFGQQVGEANEVNLLSSRKLLSLARIPWFANGAIPPAGRVELTRWLEQTAPALYGDLRRALQDVLEQHIPAPAGSVARRELDFFRLQNDWLIAADDPLRRRELADKLAQEIASGNDPDITVARLLEEGSPPEGALPLPESWNKRLFPEGLPALGYKPELWQLVPALGLFVPLLLFGWWFQPGDNVVTGDCNNAVWQVRDTVNYGQDTFLRIRICNKLDSLILSEYVWNARIKAANSVDDLDYVADNWMSVGAYNPEGAPVRLFTQSMTLSAFINRGQQDSLEQTHRENIGAMLWNRGIALQGPSRRPKPESCYMLGSAGVLLPLTSAQELTIEVVCQPRQQQQQSGSAPVDQEPDPAQQTPEQQTIPQRPQGQPPEQQAIPETDAGDENQAVQGPPTTARPRDEFSCPSNDCGDFQVAANWTMNRKGTQFSLTMENKSNTGIDYFVVDWGDGAVDTLRNYKAATHRYRVFERLGNRNVKASIKGVTTCSAGVSCEVATYDGVLRLEEGADGEPEQNGTVPPPDLNSGGPPPEEEPTVSNNDQVFKVAEEIPSFPGCGSLPNPEERKKCSDQKMEEFIAANLVYPEDAKRNGVSGIAVVRFVVETDGTISNVQLLRDLGAGTGQEAMRLAYLLQKSGERWRPAVMRNQYVRFQFNLPIRFRL